jgi:hypothetical protein
MIPPFRLSPVASDNHVQMATYLTELVPYQTSRDRPRTQDSFVQQSLNHIFERRHSRALDPIVKTLQGYSLETTHHDAAIRSTPFAVNGIGNQGSRIWHPAQTILHASHIRALRSAQSRSDLLSSHQRFISTLPKHMCLLKLMVRCLLDGDLVVRILTSVLHASTACCLLSIVAIQENVMNMMDSADVHLDSEGRIA